MSDPIKEQIKDVVHGVLAFGLFIMTVYVGLMLTSFMMGILFLLLK
jgi:hypothetical protein